MVNSYEKLKGHINQHNFENMSEWKNKVAAASRKLYKLAEECLNNYPSLR